MAGPVMPPLSMLSKLGAGDASYRSFVLADGTVLREMWERVATWFAELMRSVMCVGSVTERSAALTSDP